VPTERLNAKFVTSPGRRESSRGASGCQAGFVGLVVNAALLPGITPPN
jgi:hypothetical protein